jgi:hypothetical protein
MTGNDVLILAIDELCRTVKLCKISAILQIAKLSGVQLEQALQSAVSHGYVILLGRANPGGYLWLTAKGAARARALREKLSVRA